MTSLVLDTNTYVAFLNADKAVVDYVQKADQIIVPFVVIGELYYGFFRGTKRDENIKNLEEFLSSNRIEIANSDEGISVIFGEIATELADAGKPIQQNDIWIAAICKKLNSPLLTYDKGFKNIIGLKLLPL